MTNHNDITFNNNTLTPLPNGQVDEDDNDFEDIPNNSGSSAAGTTPPGTLPSTGADLTAPLRFGAFVFVAGALLLTVRRVRRPRPA